MVGKDCPFDVVARGQAHLPRIAFYPARDRADRGKPKTVVGSGREYQAGAAARLFFSGLRVEINP